MAKFSVTVDDEILHGLFRGDEGDTLCPMNVLNNADDIGMTPVHMPSQPRVVSLTLLVPRLRNG
jgi:hypothetical protein